MRFFLLRRWIVTGLTLCLALSWNAVLGQVEEARTEERDDTIIDPALSGQFTLPVEKQKYLWDIEHLAFILTQDIVPVFQSAFRGEAEHGLGEFLAADFRGRLFAGKGNRLQSGPVSVESWDAAEATRIVDREAFVQALASYGAPFSEFDKIGIHFTSLTPDRHGNLEGPWSTRWEIDLKGPLKSGGRAHHRIDGIFHLQQLSKYIRLESGWIDRFEIKSAWLASSPRTLMEDITAGSGINLSGKPRTTA